MIDRDRVADIIHAGNQNAGGHEILERLETAGYRVVREGMVPQIEDLDATQWMLGAAQPLAGRLAGAAHDVRKASETVTLLRDLALVVLRIDRDDVDQVDD
jgi:hypothetical protein